MNLLRYIVIITSISFALAFIYGLYVLVICEGQLASHASFFGSFCPKMGFIRHLSEWRLTFIWTLEKATFGLLAAALLLLSGTKPSFNALEFPRRERVLWTRQFDFEKFKPTISFLRFIFQGNLHPQIYIIANI